MGNNNFKDGWYFAIKCINPKQEGKISPDLIYSVYDNIEYHMKRINDIVDKLKPSGTINGKIPGLLKDGVFNLNAASDTFRINAGIQKYYPHLSPDSPLTDSSDTFERLSMEFCQNSPKSAINKISFTLFLNSLALYIKKSPQSDMINKILDLSIHFSRCFSEMSSRGNTKEDKILEFGWSALEKEYRDFLWGFVAGIIAITTRPHLFEDNPTQNCTIEIGILSTILLQSLYDSFLIVKGNMKSKDLPAMLSRNIFIIAGSIGLEQSKNILSDISFAYLMGNFVGTFMGSFAYHFLKPTYISYSLNFGWLTFKLVKENHKTADKFNREMCSDYNFFDYEKNFPPDYKSENFDIEDFLNNPDEIKFITILKRGVISVHQIGYIMD